MDLLVSLRTGNPNEFLGPFLGYLTKNPDWALSVIGELRAPDNLILRNSKIICRFLLFVASCVRPKEYTEYIRFYFRKACWSDALHVYRFRILFYKEQGTKDPTDFPEIKLMAEYILNGDVLAAKWAPSEKSMWNDEPLFIGNLLMKLTNKSPKEYRQMLSSLRTNILETLLSERRFDEINIEDIPLTALRTKRNALSKSDGTKERADLRNRYLSYDQSRAPSNIGKIYDGVCVLDNYIDAREAYDFISWIATYSKGHWNRKIVNMGEFPGIFEIPEGVLNTENGLKKYVEDKLFGGGILVLDKVYELLLGQCLLWGAEVPKVVYVFTNTPLRRKPNLEIIEKLYKTHGREMPVTLYVNVGTLRGHKTMHFPFVYQLNSMDEITLGLVMRNLGPVESVEPTTGSIDKYVKVFYW
jgi:hypothetical protein